MPTDEETAKLYKEQHETLDAMVAAFLLETRESTGEVPLPSKTTLMAFMEWSSHRVGFARGRAMRPKGR